MSFMSTSTEIDRVIKGFYCIPFSAPGRLKNMCSQNHEIVYEVENNALKYEPAMLLRPQEFILEVLNVSVHWFDKLQIQICRHRFANNMGISEHSVNGNCIINAFFVRIFTKDTPYLYVFYEYFNRNWSCYKGFLLYSLLSTRKVKKYVLTKPWNCVWSWK